MLELIEKTKQNFIKHFSHSPELYSQAPGRINIIGEHTDYTGGLSLPAAIDRWTAGAWRQRADEKIKIYSSNMDELWETSWTEMKGDIDKNWKKYIAGALLLFKESQFKTETPPGIELSLTGNIPLGKGLSSSASIELMVLNGVALLFKKNTKPVELAKIAQQVEHQFLGVKSGLLDQFASQFSKKDGALLIDFETLETKPLSLGKDFDSYCWVLVDSLVERELSSSKYSERVDEYKKALEVLEREDLNFRSTSSTQVPGLFKDQPENILKRARHIISENERTMKAFEDLQSGQVAHMGQLLLESHESLSKDYEVSHKNLDFLIETGKTMNGVMGGRMMGGGFGGCALFLVKKEVAPEFSKNISSFYEKFSGLKTDPRSYQFVDGASAWSAKNEH